MKILRVIVDELPVNCSSCRWWEHGSYTGFQVICGLVVREIDTDKLSTRPGWCPLWLQVPPVMSPDELPILNSRIASGDIDFG
jgi:hypothetical protein